MQGCETFAIRLAVTLFATGEGRLTLSATEGRLPAPSNWPVPESPCSITFGGVPGDIVFRGEVYAGVLQLNVKIHATASAGDSVPVVLQAGSTDSTGTAKIVIEKEFSAPASRTPPPDIGHVPR